MVLVHVQPKYDAARTNQSQVAISVDVHRGISDLSFTLTGDRDIYIPHVSQQIDKQAMHYCTSVVLRIMYAKLL